MPRGGARINSGPAPDPNALRRDKQFDKDGWTTLPAAGYAGEVPGWPLAPMLSDSELSGLLSERELAHWATIWRTPQAHAWVRLGWVHDVALYVRYLTLAEAGDMKIAGEVRQWSDRLGLNPAAMLRNRWRISADELGEKRSERVGASSGRQSARERMKMVNGGGA